MVNVLVHDLELPEYCRLCSPDSCCKGDLMKQPPESVFLVTSLWDADAPAHNALFYTVQEALELVLKHHAYAAVTVRECHPEKGVRTVLSYAPDAGLMDLPGYQTHEQRWKPGYGAEKVRSWLGQYPAPINPGWKQ